MSGEGEDMQRNVDKIWTERGNGNHWIHLERSFLLRRVLFCKLSYEGIATCLQWILLHFSASNVLALIQMMTIFFMTANVVIVDLSKLPCSRGNLKSHSLAPLGLGAHSQPHVSSHASILQPNYTSSRCITKKKMHLVAFQQESR